MNAQESESTGEIVTLLDRVFGSGATVPSRGTPDHGPSRAGMRLREAIAEYEAKALADAEKDVRVLARDSFRRWRRRWHDAPVATLGGVDLNLYLHDLARAERDPALVMRERELLDDFLAWCRRAGEGSETPPSKKRSSGARAPSPPGRDVSWDLAEQRRLLRACRPERVARVEGDADRGGASAPPYLLSTVLLGLQTGVKLRHLLRLEWEHVDLEGRQLSLPPLLRGRSKALTVPLPRPSIRLLRALRGALEVFPAPPRRVLAAQGLPEDESGEPDEATVRARFQEAVGRARIRPGDFGCLQRAFARNCVRGGVSFLDAASRVDWDDVGVLVRAYTSRTARAQREREREARTGARPAAVVRKLPRLAGSGPGGRRATPPVTQRVPRPTAR